MTKRFVSLLMAVMLIIGIFAVPAMAAQGDDGIDPHAPWTHCSNCQASVPVNTYSRSEDKYQTCREPYGMHLHRKVYQYKDYSCSSCGNYELLGKTLTDDICLG